MPNPEDTEEFQQRLADERADERAAKKRRRALELFGVFVVVVGSVWAAMRLVTTVAAMPERMDTFERKSEAREREQDARIANVEQGFVRLSVGQENIAHQMDRVEVGQSEILKELRHKP